MNEDDLQVLLQQYAGSGGIDGLIGGMSPPRSGLERALMNPLVQFGLGTLAANRGNYGALGPALGAGALAMQNAAHVQSQDKLRNLQSYMLLRKMALSDAAWKQAFGGGAPGAPGAPGGAGGGMASTGYAPADFAARVAVANQDVDKFIKAQQLGLDARKLDPAYIQKTEGIKAQEGARYAPDIKRVGPHGEETYNRPLDLGAPGSGPARGATPAQVKQEEKIAVNWADQYDAAQKAALAAGSRKNTYAAMQSMLPDFETGKAVPTITDLQAWGQSLGIDLGDVEKIGAKQAFDALSKQLALQNRNPSGGAGMPGSLSNQDRNYLTKTVPGLAMTKGGNYKMIEVASKLAQRDQEVAYIMEQYRKQYGTLDGGVQEALQQWADAHPLFGGK